MEGYQKCNGDMSSEGNLIFSCNHTVIETRNDGSTIHYPALFKVYSPVGINDCDQGAYDFCQNSTKENCYCILGKYNDGPDDEVGTGEN